ncbi:AraC family transcriptional regulator [Salmonella enterica]|nr:AraC family transcriptional regulator [Salmonella enterica]EFV3692199.1 helix-turn-helix transcriptional regulator [Salmonella enterica]EFV3714635.1 helix-turn-helix transcriptional regulator [Salmonella enterica]EHJ8972686.1 helix-turn-helix transcriptional regulator [Salmonella enterica]
MEKLRRLFLTSNADIVLVENCTLPYISLPTDKLGEGYCHIDIFYVQHGIAELIFNRAGSKKIQNGEFILFNKRINDCFILADLTDADVLHARITVFGLYHDFLMSQVEEGRLQIFSKENSCLLPIIHEIVKLLPTLKKEASQSQLCIGNIIALFFAQIFLFYTHALFQNHGANHQFSTLMLDIIKEPGGPWQVKDMADKYNMNINLFIREFKRVSGFTPFNFLKKVRLNKARQLIENTDIPISVIAEDCGYNSHASFTFYIKKEFGVSPIKMRKKHKIKYDSIYRDIVNDIIKDK